MITKFDEVFEQLEAPEYPATCDQCGLEGTNATIEEHECEAGNPDPEAHIEQMIHELAYERVKQSFLFNLSSATVDRKANELAEQVGGLVETWILAEVSKA